MKCECADDFDRIPDEIREKLDSLDLLQPFKRLTMAFDSVRECHHAVLKAERSKALGLGRDMTSWWNAKAKRENAAVVRQIKGVNDELKNYLRDTEWVIQANEITQDRVQERKKLLKEAQERVVEAIFDCPVSGPEAKEILKAWDSASKTFTDKGLPGVVKMLSGQLDKYLEFRKAPDYGRQHMSPQTANQATCVAAATGFYIAMLGVCSWVPFCWCCYSGALHVLYIQMLNGCL